MVITIPRDYVKKRRPRSYYTAKGLASLHKAVNYLEQVADLKGSQTLQDLRLFIPFIAEYHAEVTMQEEGINTPKQTKLETPDPVILKGVREQ